MIKILYRPAQNGLMIDLPVERLAEVVRDRHNLIWVDLDGEDPNLYRPILADTFGFHALAIDDALIESHVPKIDDWSDYIYLVLHAVDFDLNALDVDTHEVDFFLGSNYLVTHHTDPVRAIDRTWAACQRDTRHLIRGADYLLFELTDVLVSDFMPCIDSLDEAVDRVEDEVFAKNSPSSTLNTIFTLKRAAVHLRRILSPQREVLNRMARDDYKVIDQKERVYFRGVYDHLVRLVDINESLRDLIGGVLDTYLSAASNRLNEVMKILTVVTLLFMPLTFLTGFLGMNFFGPTYEVTAPTNGVVLLVLAVASMIITPLMLWYWLKRRGWV
jgi:magnesium transporter